MKLIRFIWGFLFLVTVFQLHAQAGRNDKLLDSISRLQEMAKATDFSIEERMRFADLAYQLSVENDLGSEALGSIKIQSNIYLGIDSMNLYFKANHRSLQLATTLRDSSSLAFILQSLGYYHGLESKLDSSYYYYYQAREMCKAIKDVQREAETTMSMADIQETAGDLVGAENNAIKAIKLIQNLPQDINNFDNLWILNNLIGIMSRKVKMYDKALEYYNVALRYAEKMGDDGFFKRMLSLNNIALAYKEMENYETSLEYFERVSTTKDIMRRSPHYYALNMSNYALTKYLTGDYPVEVVFEDLWNAKKISDTLGYTIGKLAMSKSLAEIYLDLENKDSAFYYANQAYDLANRTGLNEEVLSALMQMAKADPEDKASTYLNDHIKLKDSLLQLERSNINKFARIEFETEQIMAENVQISRERLIFLLSSIGLLVTLVLLYIIISQRAKNKQLEFNQRQQEANEEIYNLMLAQQDKVDEGRSKEKKRISEELHDGILGRLFGTRLSLDSLNLQNGNEAVKTRGQYIEELKSIEQEIRKISHDLNADFIEGSSFSDILKNLVEDQTKAFELTYEFNEDESIDWDTLSNKTKIHIYRMLQESMQNVYKHANAEHIKISFQLKNNVILLTVEDDGSGFNINKARKGIGLKNFDSRANEIGGRVEIFSKQGQGTKVKIFAPTG